jgi:hypothetical protein
METCNKFSSGGGNDEYFDCSELGGGEYVFSGGYFDSGVNANGLRNDGQPLGYGCGPSRYDSLVPDRIGSMNFIPACIAHDQCYDTGSTTARSVCDAQFGRDIKEACLDANYPWIVCAIVGEVYHWGVALFGASAYHAGQANSGGVP